MTWRCNRHMFPIGKIVKYCNWAHTRFCQRGRVSSKAKPDYSEGILEKDDKTSPANGSPESTPFPILPHWRSWLFPSVLASCLVWLIYTNNLLLFHTFAELFAICVAVIAFVVVWYTHGFSRNYYLLFVGIGYFWIGVLDAMHTFAYKGMFLLPDTGGNLSTQYWISTRYLESLIILAAPLFLTVRFSRLPVFMAFGVVAMAIIALISSNHFPTTYIEGVGLTPFKVYSEYVIIAILAAGIVHISRKRALIGDEIYSLMLASIVLTMLAELAFTFYVSVFGLSNLVGHIFKLFSYWLIFIAIIRTTLTEPFVVMARNASSFDGFSDPTIVVSSNGTIVQANAAANNAADMESGELLSQRCHSYFHPKTFATETCPLCQAIAEEVPAVDKPYYFPETNRWYEFSLTPIESPKAVIHVRRDVTDRMRDQEGLHVLNTAISQIQSSVVITDETGVIEYVNPTFETVTGYSLEEVRGRRPSILSSGQTPAATYARMWERITAKKSWRADLLNKRKNGELYWENVSISPVLDKAGKITHFISVQDDITDRQRAEGMILRLGQMVDDSVNEIFVIDEKTLKIVQTNQGISETLGYSRQELADISPCDFIEGMTPKILREKLSPTKKDDSLYVNFETVQRRKDGSLCDVNLKVRRVSTEQPPVYLAVGEDVTDRLKAEAALRQAMKMESIGRLTGGIAHDFNNLLGIVIGNLDMLEEDLEGTPTGILEIAAAKRAALRGADLTRRLLAFSRHTPQELNICNLATLITDMQPMLSRLMMGRITLTISGENDVWNVELDPGDFEDSLLNLALNAVDAMPDGGALTILAENKVVTGGSSENESGISVGEYVVISVTDTGSGISETQQEKIFEPFFSSKPRGKGTGLGLSMVYGFVTRSKGSVIVESALGKGTTFRLYFPRTSSEEEATSDIVIAHELPGGTETILIVDDEPDLIDIAASFLESLGYRVLTASGPDKAFEALKNARTPIDLMFTDIVMPGSLSGVDLCKKAREHYPGLRFLLTTGHSRGYDTMDEDAKKPFEILHKPYRKETLAVEIRAVLDGEGSAT